MRRFYYITLVLFSVSAAVALAGENMGAQTNDPSRTMEDLRPIAHVRVDTNGKTTAYVVGNKVAESKSDSEVSGSVTSGTTRDTRVTDAQKFAAETAPKKTTRTTVTKTKKLL